MMLQTFALAYCLFICLPLLMVHSVFEKKNNILKFIKETQLYCLLIDDK